MDICTGCIRDTKGVTMNESFVHYKYMSPYELILFASKCTEGACKHDKS